MSSSELPSQEFCDLRDFVRWCFTDFSINKNKSSKMSRIEASIILLVGCFIFLSANASEESSLDMITYEWDTNLKLLNIMKCLLSPPFSSWNRTEVEKWQFEICLAPYGELHATLHHRSPSHIKVYVELLIINQEYENATKVSLAIDAVFNGTVEKDLGRIPYREQRGFVMKNRIRFAARIQSDQIPINNREEPTTISYKWDVSLDSLKLANKQDIYSPEFLALIKGQQTVWQIKLRPFKLDDIDYVSMGLQYRGETSITTICDITLVNAEPEFSFRLYNWRWDFRPYSRCEYPIVTRKQVLTEKNGFVFGNNIRIEVRLPADGRSLNDLESESLMIPFTWEVKKTDLQLSTGQYLLSPNITTWKGKSKETWQVRIYPNGFSSDYSDHVSLFLAHRGDNKLKSKWTLSIVNNDVRKTESRSGTSNFEYDLNGFGSESFIKKTLLNDPTKGFLVDDKIKINVELPSDPVQLPFVNDCPASSSILNPASLPQPVNALSPTTASINATLQNLYREFKVKTPNGLEFSINHIMSFESIEKLMTSLVQLSCK